MARMRVSVAMATYNGSRFVDEQLRSIAAQTQPPDELVVCDDESSDDTAERLDRFASEADFEVRVHRNVPRLTTSPNFEKAVSLCTGDIVFLADQDDVWMPEKVEVLSSLLDENPSAGAVFCNGRVTDSDLKPLHMDLWKAQFFSPREQERVRRGRSVEVFLRHVVAAGTTMAFRTRYRDLYLPFPALRDCHDSWIAFTIAAVADFYILDRNLIDYRVHDANQFGLRELTLPEQFAAARKQIDIGAFTYAVNFFTAAHERLAGNADFPCSDHILELIGEKIDHSRVRDEMSSRLLLRAPQILAEALGGRYSRYSYGIKSVAQDIFLR